VKKKDWDWDLEPKPPRYDSAVVILVGHWPPGVGQTSHPGRQGVYGGYPFRLEDLGELISALPSALQSKESQDGREVDHSQKHQQYLTTSEAASRLHLTRKTLEMWRFERKGPPYRKFGRKVLYHLEELDRWARAQARSATAVDDPIAA